ncbi:MAG: flippase-like domain-containing protein [Deltaproteobacteria bacterium]|nr:flippase-like domain-containing protein [Deltaproteobacteria bacterium]
MFRSKKIIVTLIIGLLLSGIALYVVFRNIPLSELVDYLKSVNYWWAIPTSVIIWISFVFRVVRWQLLLSPFKKTDFWSAHHPLMIGFMLNSILPGRVGELARPAILYKKEGVPFSKVLATVGAERVFDVVVLLFSFVLVLMTVEISPELDMRFGDYRLNKATLDQIGIRTLQFSIVLIAGIVLVSMKQTHRFIRQLVLALPRALFFASNAFKEKFREKFCMRLVHIFDNFSAGFDLLKSPRKVAFCLGLSCLVWGAGGASYYVFSLGCPGINLSFLEIYAVMVILCFFISLPSAPGYWGLWEAGGVFALLIFGVPKNEAAGFTLASHVVQMLPVIMIGIVSAIITGVSVVQVAYTGGEDRPAEEKV